MNRRELFRTVAAAAVPLLADPAQLTAGLFPLAPIPPAPIAPETEDFHALALEVFEQMRKRRPFERAALYGDVLRFPVARSTQIGVDTIATTTQHPHFIAETLLAMVAQEAEEKGLSLSELWTARLEPPQGITRSIYFGCPLTGISLRATESPHRASLYRRFEMLFGFRSQLEPAYRGKLCESIQQRIAAQSRTAEDVMQMRLRAAHSARERAFSRVAVG